MSDDSLLVQTLEDRLKRLKSENDLLHDKNQELYDINDKLNTELIRVAHFRNLLKTLRMVVNEE